MLETFLAGETVGVVSIGFGFLFLFSNLCPFLAVNRVFEADYLIVEGWIPAYAHNRAKEMYQSGDYFKLLTCGATVPNDWGTNSVVTYADYGVAKLTRLGLPIENIQAVPAGEAHVDRTYAAAVAFKDWLRTNAGPVRAINVVTLGPHARRSRLLFQKAFGHEVQIGIISVPDREYRSDRWWQSSEGVREVVGETIAYLYARFLFSPSEPPAPK